jgi:Spy/CpxP family protein refolding chaperone
MRSGRIVLGLKQIKTGEHVRMTRHCPWIFLLAFLVATSATAAPLCEGQRGTDQRKPEDQRKGDNNNRPEDPPRWKWWLHPESRKELRLTDHQVQKIDRIFEEVIPKQRERWHEIERLDKSLAQMVSENTADVANVSQLVDRLEKLRAEERSARTVMIYRMRLLLNPEQRQKVEVIRARLDEDRRRQDDERRKQGRDKESGKDSGKDRDEKRDDAPPL